MQRIKHDNKAVAIITDNGELFKEVNTKKHLFRIMDAWGINYDALQRIEDDNIIHIVDEEGIHFRISKKEALLYGKKMHFKTKGYELQLFVPRKHFKKSFN